MTLINRIEEAIKLASQLGSNAFDFVEGRGLRELRVNIATEIKRLENLTDVNVHICDCDISQTCSKCKPQTNKEVWRA